MLSTATAPAATAAVPATDSDDPVLRWAARREAANRENSKHSTGPRTDAGKQRSSLNALTHGLTARTAVLPSENAADYEKHCRQFRDQYQPANATETQLVTELADTAWRLNRIVLLETDLLAQAAEPNPEHSPQAAVDALSKLGLYSSRLSRQFQKARDQLKAMQEERRETERHQLRDAAQILELYKLRGLPWQPSDHGFVFSLDQVQRHRELMIRQNEARHASYAHFQAPPSLTRSFVQTPYE